MFKEGFKSLLEEYTALAFTFTVVTVAPAKFLYTRKICLLKRLKVSEAMGGSIFWDSTSAVTVWIVPNVCAEVVAFVNSPFFTVYDPTSCHGTIETIDSIN